MSYEQDTIEIGDLELTSSLGEVDVNHYIYDMYVTLDLKEVTQLRDFLTKHLENQQSERTFNSSSNNVQDK